jgi:hypothetical protein
MTKPWDETMKKLILELPGLLPLLPLTKGGTEHERVLTMFDRLQQTPGQT